MSYDIVYKLKRTKGLSNRILAFNIERLNGRLPIQSERDYKKNEKNKKKAYQLFLRLIDDSSKTSLDHIDCTLDELIQKVSEQSGWWMLDQNFVYIDRCHSLQDIDFTQINTYMVVRSKDGYVPSSSNVIENAREESFCEYFHDTLDAIHGLLCDKERIMNGRYTLKDKKNRELVHSIVSYLNPSNKSFESYKK